MDKQPADEKLYELEITTCDDGDLLLEQGLCWNCDERVTVRLHPSHFPLLGDYAGLVPAGDVARATARLRDRLVLMASLVRAHTQPGDPLRLVTDDLMRQEGTGHESRPVAAFSPDAGNDGLSAVQESTGGHSGQPCLL